jgi:hypothetical protein
VEAFARSATEVFARAPAPSSPDARVDFPAPQVHVAARTPQPFTVPAAPITRRMLAPDAAPAPIDLPPTSRRPATYPSYSHETPSLAPVAMSTSLGLASRGAPDPTVQLRRASRTSARTMTLAVLLAGMFAGLAVAIVLVVPDAFARSGILGRWRGNHDAKPAAVAAKSPDVGASGRPAPSAAKTAAPAKTAEPAKAAEPAAPVVAPVSVDALPKASGDVAPDMTLVTLPASAKNHRIFVDGRVVSNGKAPITVKCGKRKLQIGSSGKPRVTELPCGSEVSID